MMNDIRFRVNYKLHSAHLSFIHCVLQKCRFTKLAEFNNFWCMVGNKFVHLSCKILLLYLEKFKKSFFSKNNFENPQLQLNKFLELKYVYCLLFTVAFQRTYKMISYI